uniref:Uncharacterized protein n=1 Tax=Anguilla anguilla TaxID=7936 RepID=A0A0E9V4Y0_ANGAN
MLRKGTGQWWTSLTADHRRHDNMLRRVSRTTIPM